MKARIHKNQETLFYSDCTVTNKVFATVENQCTFNIQYY